MKIETLYDQHTSTFTYIIIDEETNKSAIIDPVLEYNQYNGILTSNNANQIVNYIKKNGLQNEWILETHIHADHISAAHYLKKEIGGNIGIGSEIIKVLDFWVKLFEIEKDTPVTGEQFDFLFNDKEIFKIGNINVKVMHTPGHTPACISYIIDDCIFVGDTILSPKIGSARCDFPGGSAKVLYDSIHKIYTLPEHIKIHLCHDYPINNEDPISVVTVGEQKKYNSMINLKISKEEFIELRETKDYGKEVPKLIIPAIQFNLRGGTGDKSINDRQFIKVPINALKKEDGKFKKITSNYFVAGQLNKDDIIEAKKMGFNSIICNRPDNESTHQPTADGLKQFAEKQDMFFVYQPVTMATLTMQTIEQFDDYYNNLKKPILGFCKTGGRSTRLWELMKQIKQEAT